jgi:hypothetical protein
MDLYDNKKQPLLPISKIHLTLHFKVLFMKNISEPHETLSEIRSMMERSSRFISLNGLSGVFAGIFALLGAYAAYRHLAGMANQQTYYETVSSSFDISKYLFFVADALIVMLVSIATAIWLSVRKASKKKLKVWDSTTKRLIINLLIPLATGGILCFILLLREQVGMIAPLMLIFYGLALINASKYTFTDIRYLGICETLIGLAAAIWIGYGLIFWAFGFGILHIIYGIVMYYRYER